MRTGRRRILGVASATLVFLAGFALWYYLAPISLADSMIRLRLWRHGVRTADIRGLHTYVRHIGNGGEGRCVALVHGIADSAATFEKVLTSPAALWEHPVTLYAFDLPGSGRTPAPANPAEYRVREQAKTLRQALEPTCTRWLLVGNSLGGWIAAWVAHDWPTGAMGLILADAVGLKDDTLAVVPYLDHLDEDKLKTFQRLAFAHPHPLSERIWKAVTAKIQTGNLQAVLDAQDPSQTLDGQFANWHVPTLVFWGEEDHLVPVAAGHHLKDAIPGATWREVASCGHLPQKECVSDLIRAIDAMAGAVAP